MDGPRGTGVADAGTAAPMASPTASSRRPAAFGRRRVDPWFWGAVALFGAALLAAAWPAFTTDPSSAPGVLLLLGLVGVGFLAFFAFGAADTARGDFTADRLVEALDEPAALVTADGRILAANTAWIDAGGDNHRLPRGASAPALFVAMADARAGKAGRARVSLGAGDFESVVSVFAPGRYLVRAASEGLLAEPLLLTYSPPAAAAVAAPEAAPAQAVNRSARDPYANAAPFGAAVLDADDLYEGVIVETNAALVALTAGQAKAGVRFADLLGPAGVEDARARIAEGATGPIEVELKGAGTGSGPGARRTGHLYLSWDEGRRLVYLIDVSDQKRLELDLAQGQKMQAIGLLAGGVAHDFNNLLTAIQLRLDELLQRHSVGDPSYESLSSIRSTANRAADLVRKLLAFSRKQTVKREVIGLGELISDFAVLLRRLLREDVELDTDYGKDLPLLHIDKSQLETAVMNLAVNARDALRGTEDGKVKIRTARLNAGEARNLGWADAPDTDCALIEVSDNGPGIDSEVASKVFEPFFTTKPVGEGTGMGLATVYGIVEQAKGHISLESRPGEGATFRIFLPAYIPVAAPANAPEAVAKAAEVKPLRAPARDLSGAGKILFVEDEDSVRGIAATLLRARGYEVIEAADGEEALLLAEANAGEIDMLISDVIMPGMDGPSLLKKARQYLGTAPVMFISGYAEADFSDLLAEEVGVSFLPKPLDIKTLAERVKQELRPAA
jgi:two-component system cell cycle sensor histidine kinase/response regulator CckA